jgi:chemosensory pili system protein ChpA (sensor histidine kinase/response regulator)
MHRGSQTLIVMQDDGRGINLAKIRSRLCRLGMPEIEVQKLRDRDLLDMIFEPGFTTAERVTELSGRGVGMDIVRTNLQQIRGDIRVDTKLGRGTTFTIQVPLAVSVLRVMLVESANLVFAVPIDSIKGMVSLSPSISDRASSSSSEPVMWEDQPVDLVHLEDWLQFNTAGRPFEMTGTPTINQPTALIFDQGDQLHGICIDRFWGEQEISLNPIKSPISLPPLFSGTSILGDGRVIPLVDLFQLLEWTQEQQETSAQTALQTAMAQSANESQVATAESRPPSPSSVANRQVPAVLIVDDSVNVRRYLALTLEKAGYQVEQARDGQEAIDKLLAGLVVETVICDIEMPRLDGFGVLSELRSQPQYETLPIAMLTSRMNDKHRKLAMNLGASAYFSKPYNEQELLGTLRELAAATQERATASV